MALHPWALAVALAAAAALPASATEIQGVASVLDGDTIEIHGTRIRLEGIDAPESDQPCTRPDGSRWRCGQLAALALADRIGRRPLRCHSSGEDQYGRKLATCLQGGVDLNGWLVSNGWALAYRRYSQAYVPEERSARKAGRGVWSGSFDMPWDWRRRR